MIWCELHETSVMSSHFFSVPTVAGLIRNEILRYYTVLMKNDTTILQRHGRMKPMRID